MMTSSKNTGVRRVLAATAVLVLTLAVAVIANANVREVGETTNFTVPACVDNNCQVVTKVTAYQQQVGTRKNPYRISAPGKLVAFSVYLPQVGSKQYSYYADRFEGAPTAKISVLRAKPRRGVPYRYALAGQSERINLRDYLDSAPTFALAKPLDVKRGDIIALTTDTWLPSFTVQGQDNSSIWRASRPRNACPDLETTRMHAKVGQIKAYACGYKGARLVYKATVVDTPKKTKR
jgi:hypothetical protein